MHHCFSSTDNTFQLFIPLKNKAPSLAGDGKTVIVFLVNPNSNKYFFNRVPKGPSNIGAFPMKKHVLLIDNDEKEVEQFTRALSNLSLSSNCICVKSTEHAVQVLSNYSPDFIFIAHDVSKERTLRCLQQIKKLNNVKNVPVILYSNQMDEENNVRAMSMGAFACIKKPSMTGTLARKLKDIMVGKVDRLIIHEQGI